MRVLVLCVGEGRVGEERRAHTALVLTPVLLRG